MTPEKELFEIADRLERIGQSEALLAAEADLRSLDEVASKVGRAFSGSWLGHHANVYYADLQPPPPSARFSQEWGLKDMSYTSMGSRGDWRKFDPHELEKHMRSLAGDPDLEAVKTAAKIAAEELDDAKARIHSILVTENLDKSDAFLSKMQNDLEKLNCPTKDTILQIWAPKGAITSRDMIAIGEGPKAPPHISIKAEVFAIQQPFLACGEAGKICRKAASHIERRMKSNARSERIGTNAFIGHGRSMVWRELKDFIQDRLHLPWDEFNRVPVAGVTNQARLAEMLDAAAVAFVVMTAEDETAEGQVQARMNVIHEVGLFQGRLGFTKAIVLLEDGCEEFSNIQGLGQIRFPKGNIAACFEEVRRVLEREGVLS